MKFTLSNKDGCLMQTITADTIEEAKRIFSESYEGNFNITFEGERIKVEL